MRWDGYEIKLNLSDRVLSWQVRWAAERVRGGNPLKLASIGANYRQLGRLGTQNF